SLYSFGDDSSNRVFVCDCHVDRIGECNCRASPPVLAVAPRTVFRVQSGELQNLSRRQSFRTPARLTVRRFAPRNQHSSESCEYKKLPHCVHGRSPCVGIVPGASTPARSANAMFSRVGTRGCRTTTSPATTPKATCDAMNQNQSM